MLTFLIILLIAIPLSIRWVKGIDYMKINHSEYKGLDLFDEEDKNMV
jgi:hypothetical protein